MRRNRRRNQGFTLLELMLVVAILVVLAGLSSFAFLNMQRNTYSRAAAADISMLKQACLAFKINVGRFPSTLEELVIPPGGMSPAQWGGPYLESPNIADPWGRPYMYSADDLSDRVFITSVGPDGQQGTADDIPPPGSQ